MKLIPFLMVKERFHERSHCDILSLRRDLPSRNQRVLCDRLCLRWDPALPNLPWLPIVLHQLRNVQLNSCICPRAVSAMGISFNSPDVECDDEPIVDPYAHLGAARIDWLRRFDAMERRPASKQWRVSASYGDYLGNVMQESRVELKTTARFALMRSKKHRRSCIEDIASPDIVKSQELWKNRWMKFEKRILRHSWALSCPNRASPAAINDTYFEKSWVEGKKSQSPRFYRISRRWHRFSDSS